jgi:hypothetical protein
VVLVLSGAILGGCSRREDSVARAEKTSQVVTNDTYIEGRGYYHAPFHGFFPFPYNHYVPSQGYFRGGQYHSAPDLNIPKPTLPGKASSPSAIQARAARDSADVTRGGFTHSSSWSSSS